MKIAVDTNVLVRMFVSDDAEQSGIAQKLLASAEAVAISVPTLCEFVWVLTARYRLRPADVAAAIQGLLETANVVMERPAVEAGLEQLSAGGDFADGAMAYEGRRLGAESFVSFDRKAVALLTTAGHAAHLAT